MQRQGMQPGKTNKTTAFRAIRERSPALFILALLAGLIGGAFAGLYAWMESWLTELRMMLATGGGNQRSRSGPIVWVTVWFWFLAGVQVCASGWGEWDT